MSRLYAWIESDTRKTEVTSRGHGFINAKINYGGKDDSKPAVRLSVVWDETKNEPMITVETAKGLRLTVNPYGNL